MDQNDLCSQWPRNLSQLGPVRPPGASWMGQFDATSSSFDARLLIYRLSPSSTLQLHPLSEFALDYLIQPTQAIDGLLDYLGSELWTQSGDQRTSQLPFMSGGPWKLVFATMLYLYLIKSLLPSLMRNRNPFELNWPIRVYNLLMVMGNLYSFVHALRILEFGRRCFGCEIINGEDTSPQTVELLHYGWLFFVSRIVEWLDTIFFVLRKKERQVTKLHVFHHSFVPLLCWTYLKYHPGYTMAFFPLVNTLVHTIMYTYYFLATFGPRVQPYLWWKKYLTSMQIIQFVLILIQLASIPLGANDQCHYPQGFIYTAFGGAFLFLWLFYTYYLETYNSTKNLQQRTAGSHGLLRHNPRPLHSDNDHQLIATSKAREGSSYSFAESIENAIETFTAPGGRKTDAIRHFRKLD